MSPRQLPQRFQIDLTQKQLHHLVHVAMLVSGFVVLAIYTVIYRLWPALKASPIAKAQFWIAVVAVLGQVVGAYQFATSGGTRIATIASSSVLAIIAGVAMAWVFWAGSAESPSPLMSRTA